MIGAHVLHTRLRGGPTGEEDIKHREGEVKIEKGESLDSMPFLDGLLNHARNRGLYRFSCSHRIVSAKQDNTIGTLLISRIDRAKRFSSSLEIMEKL